MQRKGEYYAENVKTKQARMGVVYQSQDRQEELQRSMPQMLATMQAELSRDRSILPKICSDLGQEKLQRSVPQVFATMQTELSCNRGFLSKICSDLGPEKRPGFTRK